METKVLTPKGFKLIGDIESGEQVCNPDGTVAQVVRVTDNGLKRFYKITLADGSSVEADEDHLWAVSTSGARKARKVDVPVIPTGLRPQDEWNLRIQTRCRVVTTLELREMALRAAGEKARGLRPHYPQLPLMMPAKMTAAQGRWEVLSPYILGALVGDGSLGNRDVTSICGVDEEVFDRIRAELPEHLQLSNQPARNGCPTYHITRRVKVTDEEATQAFVAELKRLMQARGWQQYDLLARVSAGNQSYISAVSNGRKRPATKFVAMLDEVLGADGSLLEVHAQHAGPSATDLLARDHLHGTHSWNKFIPARIKAAPAEDRFAFIQGLFDTDGHMDDRGHVEFVTVSEQLALDTQEVLRSLGYRATLNTKKPTYMHQGEKKEGRLAYRLYVMGRHMDRLFHMPRKRERVAQYNGGDVEPWHRVVSVEPSGYDYSRCITVDNLNHLYVTDDYIVTHNSIALVAEAIKWCARYPGLRAMIVRRTYDELAESILPALRRFAFAQAIGGKYNGVRHELSLPGGSLLSLRYLETVDDAARRQGGQVQFLGCDEVSLLNPGIVDFIRYERLRSGSSDIPVIGVRATANPGGASHAEVKDRYVDSTDFGRKVVTDPNGLTIRFIPAKATDNPHLDPGYRARLDAIPDPNRRAAMRDGDWSVFSGMVFPDFSMDRHVVEPIALPEGFRRFCGVDWGYTAPFCTLWGAVDPDSRLWVYREIYERQVGEAEQARMVLAAERHGEHIEARWSDDSMFALRGDALPIAHIWGQEGVHLTPAGKGPGSRITGWQRIHSYLAEGPACAHHRAAGWTTCPMLHVFSHCKALVREFRSLPYATVGNPEDSDPKADDHALDALRYLTVNLGGGAQFFSSPEPRQAATAELLTPMGQWAVRDDPNAPVSSSDPDKPKPGLTQTWEQALAGQRGPGGT